MPQPIIFDDSNAASYLNIGKISIWFRSKQCSGNPGDNFPPGYLSTYTLSNQGSLNETLKDTTLAYFNIGTDTPTNQSVLDALTSIFAVDYTNWRRVTFDLSLIGICGIVPSALCDCHEWDYNQDGCKTRIYSYPFNYMIQELGHYDNPNDCLTNSSDPGDPNFDAAPWIAFFGPPGFCGSCGTATGGMATGGMASATSTCLQLARWEFMEQDGRLVKRFLQFDIFGELESSIMSTSEPSHDIIQFSRGETFSYLYTEFRKCG